MGNSSSNTSIISKDDVRKLQVLETLEFSEYLSLNDLCILFNVCKNVPLKLYYFKRLYHQKKYNYIFDFLNLKVQEFIAARLFEKVFYEFPLPNINTLKDIRGKTLIMKISEKGYSKFYRIIASVPKLNLYNGHKHGYNLLHSAAESCNLEFLKLILNDNKFNINQKTKCGKTPLHLAVIAGNKECIQYLLKSFASSRLHQKSCASSRFLSKTCQHIDINDSDSEGFSALHIAINNKRLDLVKILLEDSSFNNNNINNNININTKDNSGNTPLHLACKDECIGIVQYLLTIPKIDINSMNNSNNTPLHIAIEYKHFEIAKYLIEFKDIELNYQNSNGNTPLHLVVKCNNLEIVKILVLEKKCNVNLQNYINFKYPGYTPLHIACQYGFIEIVKILVSVKDIDFNLESHRFISRPLDIAISNGHKNIVKFLFPHSENREENLYFAILEYSSSNSLQKRYTKKYNNNMYDIILYLLSKRKYNFSKKFDGSNTLLHMICKGYPKYSFKNQDERNQYNKIIKYLAFPENINIQDENGETALHIVCKYGILDIFKILISFNNIDFNLKNNEGFNCLHYACSQYNVKPDIIDMWHYTNYSSLSNYSEITTILLSMPNICINTRNKYGATPLFIAISKKNIENVKKLLSFQNIDLSIKYDNRITSFEYAIEVGNNEIIDLIVKKILN
jgi:ankyrin repeat protein